MSLDLSTALNTVGSLLGSNASGAAPLAQQIIQQAAVGAAASASLAALTHPDVVSKFLPIDPLGLANKMAAPTAAPAPGTPAPVGASPAPVYLTTQAGWAALPLSAQEAISATHSVQLTVG
jgi:hypothetical protein